MKKKKKGKKMSYNSMMEMAGNHSLISRIAACAAEQNLPENPINWAQQNVWSIVSEAGWADNWDYAKANYNINQNPDTGLRTDVITDAMILGVVQPMVQAIINPPA